MKRIALVQPRIKTGKSLGIKKSPESIQSLASQLEKDHDVKMYHSEAGEELNQQLEEFDPEVVGISTMTPNFPEGKKIAEEIKQIKEDVLVVLGGWHASGVVQAYRKGQEDETFDEIFGEDSPFDYVVSGEGEEVFPEIIRRFESGEPIDEIEGVGLNIAQRIKTLDILEDPSWKDINIDEYRDQRTGALDLSVHFNRSCRFKCGFCSTPEVYGRGVTAFSPERAIGYIKKVVAKGPQVITFTDEDFFAKPAWVEKLVDLLEESKIEGVEFDTFASINDILKIDETLLKRMKAVGFNSFTVGVESLNPKVLRDYNKEQMVLGTFDSEERAKYKTLSKDEQDKMLANLHFEKAQEAINKAQNNGILVIGDYILGNLGETEDEVKEGFEKFSQLKGLIIAYIPTFTPFPGTKLWKDAYESGKLKRSENGSIDWSKFDASEGALDLGYDIASLRNNLELQFYTSKRYQKDMFKILKVRPELLPMFIGRFNYLKTIFGESEIINKILVELSNLKDT